MTRHQQIRLARQRNERALALRPGIGRGTAATTVRLVEGLACEVADGPWRLAVDMGAKHGGRGSGPDPGVLGRGALGACLLISYQLWAARLGLELAGVEVVVEADYDAGGLLGVGDAAPGYGSVRTIVTLTSDAPEGELRRLAELAEAHAPYRDVFARAIPVRGALRLLPATAAASLAAG